jgi:hypothetical protein
MGFKSAGGIALSYVLMSVIRVVQLALALAVCGLYGVDLQAARNAGKNVDGRWVSRSVFSSSFCSSDKTCTETGSEN